MKDFIRVMKALSDPNRVNFREFQLRARKVDPIIGEPLPLEPKHDDSTWGKFHNEEDLKFYDGMSVISSFFDIFGNKWLVCEDSEGQIQLRVMEGRAKQ